MTKHPYQTCLRMPLILKEEMTTICNEYQINESDLMRKAIADAVGIKSTAVSVKGKTNEGVDATGRGEAIATHAVAMLSQIG